MKQTYRLTYDFGSGSVKAALVGRDYQLIGEENAPYKTYFPQTGWAEQKPEELWAAMTAATHALLCTTGVPPEDIEGIALSHTATTVIFVDDDGQALTDCVMWMDGRAATEADEINAKLGENRFSGKNVISKLLWFLKHEPETVARAHHMLDVATYLSHRMTDVFAYEFTGARATCLVDIEAKKWDARMFDLIGFPRRLVPERIIGSTERVGELSEDAAKTLGLMPGTPVFGGCSDHATAILGTGCIRPGDTHIYIGTSAWLAVVTDENDPHKGRMPSPVPGMRYHFYDTDSGGACFDYLLHTYYAAEMARGENAFIAMNQEVRQAETDGNCEDVLFLPFLAGASAPIANMTVRASLLNLKRSTERPHIARAVLEGVCFNLRWMRDIHVEQNGEPVDILRGIGGGMTNEVFVQMLADVLNTRIATLENPRFAGNLGLAACIDIGLGYEQDFTVLDRVVRCGKTYEPRPENAERYTRLYELYRAAYRALEPIYEDLNGGQ